MPAFSDNKTKSSFHIANMVNDSENQMDKLNVELPQIFYQVPESYEGH